MPKATARIVMPPGIAARYGPGIELDGARLPGVVAARLDMRLGELPTLTVQLLLRGVDTDGDVAIAVDDATHRALVALGWTPPATPLTADAEPTT